MIAENQVVALLEDAGATNIEPYDLINNWGYTFEIKDKKYDARFWANCYGTPLNIWQIHSCNYRKDDPRFVVPVEPEIKQLEKKLNA